MGEVVILSVGDGDTKLTFDNKNPAETLRAGRVIRDMLRRGYALLIEVEQPDGTKAFQRALDFDERTAEYIIADFDPSYAQAPAARPSEPIYVPPPRYGTEPQEPGKTEHEEASEAPAGGEPEKAAAEEPAHAAAPRRGRPRRVPAASTRAVAVARSAGG